MDGMLTNDNMPHGGDVERGEGTIRRLVTDRGFGFIRPTRANGPMRKDLFFHAAQVVGVRYEELREDDIVSYTLADDGRGKGAVATNVERIRRAPGFSDDARRPEPEKSASSRWLLATGRATDDEDDNTYDWSQAG